MFLYMDGIIYKFGLSLMFEDNEVSFIKKSKKINLAINHNEDVSMDMMMELIGRLFIFQI